MSKNRVEEKACPRHFKDLTKYAKITEPGDINKEYLRGKLEGKEVLIIRTGNKSECNTCVKLNKVSGGLK